MLVTEKESGLVTVVNAGRLQEGEIGAIELLQGFIEDPEEDSISKSSLEVYALQIRDRRCILAEGRWRRDCQIHPAQCSK